jgi:Mg2+ and Co2+ transporter CorA
MNEDESKNKSPLFPKWSYWYALVIGFLLALIVFFYFLTKYFA